MNKLKEPPIVILYLLWFAVMVFAFHELGVLLGFAVTLPVGYAISTWTDREYKRILAKRAVKEKNDDVG